MDYSLLILFIDLQCFYKLKTTCLCVQELKLLGRNTALKKVKLS